MREVFSNVNLNADWMYLILIIFPSMSLHFKLVPVQYRDTNMAYMYTVLERRKENKDLLRVARLLNPAPRSLADGAKSEIWSNAICIRAW